MICAVRANEPACGFERESYLSGEYQTPIQVPEPYLFSLGIQGVLRCKPKQSGMLLLVAPYDNYCKLPAAIRQDRTATNAS
jgi:hypothetical protein